MIAEGINFHSTDRVSYEITQVHKITQVRKLCKYENRKSLEKNRDTFYNKETKHLQNMHNNQLTYSVFYSRRFLIFLKKE